MTTTKKYFEAIGRRKTSTARVRLTEAPKTSFLINSKALADYFPTKEMQGLLLSPFEKGEVKKHFDVSVRVSGGGINSQAGAVRHGISRALNEFDAKLRLPRQARTGPVASVPCQTERLSTRSVTKKAPQWSKR